MLYSQVLWSKSEFDRILILNDIESVLVRVTDPQWYKFGLVIE